MIWMILKDLVMDLVPLDYSFNKVSTFPLYKNSTTKDNIVVNTTGGIRAPVHVFLSKDRVSKKKVSKKFDQRKEVAHSSMNTTITLNTFINTNTLDFIFMIEL